MNSVTDFGVLIADDYSLVMDNVEPITVNLVNRTTPETVSVAIANRSMLTRNAQQYWQVTIEADMIQFSFSVVQFQPISNTNNIRKFDTIIDSDNRVYVVQTAKLATLQTRWDVLVKRQTGTGDGGGVG
jgi:hypothetical protein